MSLRSLDGTVVYDRESRILGRISDMYGLTLHVYFRPLLLDDKGTPTFHARYACDATYRFGDFDVLYDDASPDMSFVLK